MEDDKLEEENYNADPNVPKNLNSKEKGEEIHYHYYMDEAEPKGKEMGAPGGRAPPNGRPRDVHYHYYYEPPRHIKTKSSKPTIAGILLVITALLGLISSGFLLGLGFFVGDLGEGFALFGEEQKGDIMGTVTFLNGTAAEDVSISIVDEPLSTVTDIEGNYVIHNAPTGNQQIRIEKEGYNIIIYKTFIAPHTIQQDKNEEFNNEFDFTLTAGDEVLDRGSYPPWGLIRNLMLVCGVVIVIFSIIALIGAYNAFKRKGFGIAVTGAILGLFTGIGTLFALIAIFILVISRDEFNTHEVGEGPQGFEPERRT
jgi:hypothetical protein